MTFNSNQFSRNLANVTDPTDWNLSRIPELTEFDSLLRCYICKEYLRGPVMTSCNHTFCSHCIREYLVSNSHCPLCDNEQFESNLKRVIQLEEIVLCFSKVRPLLVDALSHAIPDSSTSLPVNVCSGSENVRLEVIEVESSEDEVTGKRQIPLNEAPIPRKKQKSTSNVNGTPSLSSSSNSILASLNSSENAIPTRDQMVECPICTKIMPAEKLQTSHIDNCLERASSPSEPSAFTSSSPSHALQTLGKKKKSGITSFFNSTSIAPSPISKELAKRKLTNNEDYYFKEASKHHSDVKKLQKLDFNSLTTPRLKEKMTALKLPTQGTRAQLELRYNQYYILYNANLDSNHPVSDKILKQRLSQWEHSHLGFVTNSTGSLFDTASNMSMKNITDKNFLVTEWLSCYRGEFARLTRLAKKSAERMKLKNIEILSQSQELEPNPEPEQTSASEPTSAPEPTLQPTPSQPALEPTPSQPTLHTIGMASERLHDDCGTNVNQIH